MKLSFNGTKVTVKIGSRIKTYPISASDCFLDNHPGIAPDTCSRGAVGSAIDF